MKAGWHTEKIGNICDLSTGGTPSRAKPEYFDGNIKWLVSGDIHQKEIFDCEGRISEIGMKNSNARILPLNSVMIALNGQGKTRGTVALLRTDATCNQSLVSIFPKYSDKLLPEFLYLNLHGRYEEIRRITGDDGNDRRGLNMPLIRSIEIPIAPIDEQQRIVAILDKAFEGITKARENAEQNLQNARALFESHLQSAFTQRGDGYEAKIFDEVLEIKNGKDQKPVEKAGGKYPIYGSAGNVMGWTDSYICDEQTTIIGRKGTINRPIFIETKFWNVDTAFGLAAKSNLNAKFLYFFCLSYDFSLHNRGTTIPSLVKTDLLNIKISVPSLSVQELLVKKFTVLHNETKRLEANYQRKINLLDELKKSLLQQAFSGKL